MTGRRALLVFALVGCSRCVEPSAIGPDPSARPDVASSPTPQVSRELATRAVWALSRYVQGFAVINQLHRVKVVLTESPPSGCAVHDKACVWKFEIPPQGNAVWYGRPWEKCEVHLHTGEVRCQAWKPGERHDEPIVWYWMDAGNAFALPDASTP